jgi:putative ABC transport system ATP-binding protein
MSEKNGKNVIHTEHLKKYYVMGDIEVRALHDISLDVNYGEFAAIMGPSGSGKSTLMNILGCLDRPTDGLYMLDGTDVSEMDDSQLAEVRNQKIGFVFQSFNLLPRSSALNNVLMPLLYSKNKANAKERAEAVLEMVGLGSRMKHKPKELSGGQQQRVAVARALVNDPEIIMADEPTGNLDSKSGREIMELLIKLNQEQGKTIIIVTHDPRIGNQIPRVINVFDGMLAVNGENTIHTGWSMPGNASENKNEAGSDSALETESADGTSNGNDDVASERDGLGGAADALAAAFKNGAANNGKEEKPTEESSSTGKEAGE